MNMENKRAKIKDKIKGDRKQYSPTEILEENNNDNTVNTNTRVGIKSNKDNNTEPNLKQWADKKQENDVNDYRKYPLVSK